MISHRFGHLLRLSFHSLMLHRLRSALTVLGVASVIVMLAVGEAARYEAVQQIQQLGATNLIVRSVKPQDDGKDANEDRIPRYGITLADMRTLMATLPTVRAITPLR